jgi:hypothetical protein
MGYGLPRHTDRMIGGHRLTAFGCRPLGLPARHPGWRLRCGALSRRQPGRAEGLPPGPRGPGRLRPCGEHRGPPRGPGSRRPLRRRIAWAGRRPLPSRTRRASRADRGALGRFRPGARGPGVSRRVGSACGLAICCRARAGSPRRSSCWRSGASERATGVASGQATLHLVLTERVGWAGHEVRYCQEVATRRVSRR